MTAKIRSALNRITIILTASGMTLGPINSAVSNESYESCALHGTSFKHIFYIHLKDGNK